MSELGTHCTLHIFISRLYRYTRDGNKKLGKHGSRLEDADHEEQKEEDEEEEIIYDTTWYNYNYYDVIIIVLLLLLLLLLLLILLFSNFPTFPTKKLPLLSHLICFYRNNV